MKITKSKLKIIIDQEIKALLEGEVVPVDFKNKTKRGRLNTDISLGAPDEMPAGEIPIEKTIEVMLDDMRNQVMKISNLSTASASRSRVEGDMQKVLDVIDQLALDL